MRRATSFLKGNSKETRILPFLYMIDDIEKWDSIEELKKSNPNLGVSVSEEFYIEQIEIARASLSKKVEFLTKYCNIKQNSSVAWLDYWHFPGRVQGLLLRGRHRPFTNHRPYGGIYRYMEKWKMECDNKILYAKETV